jgi:3-oxoacyl-[acyl-carrier protein] reductase
MTDLRAMRDQVFHHFSLEDKVAIVTGAGAGIGGGIATDFAAVGAKVVAVTLHEATCQETAKAIRAFGGTALPLALDVTKADDIKKMVDTVAQKFGRIDVLVNNVGGIPGGWRPALELSEEGWDAVIDVTLKSVFLCAQTAGQVMKKQKSGSIINIASGAAFHPTPYNVAYGVAKAGVVHMTTTLAVALAPLNIRVNCIAPGPVSTPGTSGLADARKWSQMYGVLLDKLGSPDDIAFAAIYFASQASAFVTGSVLEVTGGPHLGNIMLAQAEDGFKTGRH